ncbi:MAG: hypothetical protein JO334_00015 [Verrucomicrobia bacterium]|nr:hypothetical protein [Verrucomicrobiota bacterium]
MNKDENEKDLTIIVIEQKVGFESTVAARGHLPSNERPIARLTSKNLRNFLLGFSCVRNEEKINAESHVQNFP